MKDGGIKAMAVAQTFTHEIFRTLRRCSVVLHGEISTIKNKGGSLEETLQHAAKFDFSFPVTLFFPF